MIGRPTFSQEVMQYLFREVGYGQQALDFYDLLCTKFPLTSRTSVKVIDFNKLLRIDDENPRVREATSEATEMAARGQRTIEDIGFEKIDMPDERYPMENRGWTFWMGYYEGKDILMVKWVG